MDQKTYIKSVCKKLQCTKAKKEEIARQLKSDISIALENGETMEQVCERMGMVKELAAEFNENMPEEEIRQSAKARRLNVAGIILGILLLCGLMVYWLFPKVKPIEQSDIFTGEQLETKCIAVILALDVKDYELLQSEYATDIMKPYLTQDYMEEAKNTLSENWGRQTALGNCYMYEVEQRGKLQGVVEMNVSYENISVTYTMIFDKDYKLTGFWMK